MQILSIRDVFTPQATLSSVFVVYQGETEQRAFGFLCEDEDRGLEQGMPLDALRALKVVEETAIPAGLYDVTLEDSPKYGPDTLTISPVPGFVGIRVHSGNSEADTAGCLLPGLLRDVSRMKVYRSRVAVAWLREQVRGCRALGEPVTWTITRAEAPWAVFRSSPGFRRVLG